MIRLRPLSINLNTLRSLAQRRLQRLNERFTGQRCAGNDVHLGTLRLNRFVFEIRHRLGIDVLRRAPVMGVVQELNVGDFSAADNHFDLDIAVKGVGRDSCVLPILVQTALGYGSCWLGDRRVSRNMSRGGAWDVG